MIAVSILGALAVGGIIGWLSRRGRPSRTSTHRSIDTDRVDVQAGWHNMHGS